MVNKLLEWSVRAEQIFTAHAFPLECYSKTTKGKIILEAKMIEV